MFDGKFFFEQWLMNLVGDGKANSPQGIMVLVLKAQTNHFALSNIELREEIQSLRGDMDNHFEQVDKRFETLTTRIDRLMIWSFATTLSAAGGIVIWPLSFYLNGV
ncbi:MAG: hypothetical protein Q8Q40_01615 [Methylococcaceae bacterium]|nr:hypothetical protein [Methylococcaceae bacterium]MDP3902657.1 hypothetical protein [Methylococcaceae bacterium]